MIPFRLTLLLLGIALGMTLPSCGQRDFGAYSTDGTAPGTTLPPALLATLPGLPEQGAIPQGRLRNTSGLHYATVVDSSNGIDSAQTDKLLSFDAGPQQLEWALLHYDANGGQITQINYDLANLSGPAAGKIYFGMSNYSIGTWEWLSYDSTETGFDLPLSSAYTAPGSGNCYVVFAAFDDLAGDLNLISLNSSGAGHSISGGVQEDGNAANGATVQLIFDDRVVAEVTELGNNGEYSFGDLSPGDYTLRAQQAGRTFTPASIDVPLGQSDSSGHDFERQPITSTPGIHGTLSEGGVPAPGATVYLIQVADPFGNIADTFSTTTNSAGFYSFTGLVAAQYRIIPQQNMKGFTPAMTVAAYNGSAVLIRDFEMQSFSAVPAGVTYDAQMRPLLFEPVCMNCHSSGKSNAERNGAPSSVNWDTYGGTTEAKKTLANTKVHNDSMPADALGFKTTQFEKDLFQAWKDGGFPEN